MMYLISFDCLENEESFNILCENEKEMQDIIRLTSNIDSLRLISMSALPLTVKADEYITQLKKLNKPDNLFFGNKED